MSGTEQVNSEIIHKIENDGKLIQNFAMTKALWFSKIKYKLFAKATFEPGYIPLLAWFIVENPFPVIKKEGSIHDILCAEYHS